MKVAARRLLEEQIAVVVFLERGEKNDAMWHVPHTRQDCVCCLGSGVTRCTLLLVLYLDRMCQCGLYAVLWSYIGTVMRRLGAEPSSTAGL